MILPDKENGIDEVLSTHAVDIFAFVDAQGIPFRYFDTPYFLTPAPGGEKIYMLLRETLRRTRKIGVAYAVIQMQQQLAALVPHGQSLILNTLRCENECEPCNVQQLLGSDFDEYRLNASEIALAYQLVERMNDEHWWEVQLQSGSLEGNTENEELASSFQSPFLHASDIIRLENLLDWSEEQDEDILFEPVKMPSPGPHRFPRPSASRPVTNAGCVRKRRKRIR